MAPRTAPGFNGSGVRGLIPSDTVGALWLLVALELLAQVGLRRYFRKHHGG